MADNPKPGILTRLRIKRVSLVDMGANFDTKTGDGAHIMLFKRHEPIVKDGPGLGAVHVDSPEWDPQDQDDYEKSTLDATARRQIPDSGFAAVWTDAQGKKHRKLPIHDAGHLAAARGRVDEAQIPENVKAEARRKIEAATTKEKPAMKSWKEIIKSMADAVMEPDVEKRKTAVAAITKDADAMPDAPAAAGANGDPGPDLPAMKVHHDNLGKAIAAFGPGPHPEGHPVHAMKAAHAQLGTMLKAAGVDCMATPGNEGEDMAKGMSDEVRKQFTELEKSNTELKKRLDEAETMRLDGEMTSLLKSFKAVPVDLATDVVKFRKMKQADPEGFAAIIKTMQATDEMLAKSDLFKSVGSGAGGGGGDAAAQLDAKAAEMITKSATPITKEAAYDRACIDNPKLVAEMRAQQNAR